MAARPSPRLRQPYSPRHPSPLGFPPLTLGFQPLPPHMAFVSMSSPSPYQGPLTPDRRAYPRGPPETRAKVGIGGAGEEAVGSDSSGGGGGGGEGREGGEGVSYPPEARRPLAGTHSRRRSHPPALSLNNPFHMQTLPDLGAKNNENAMNMGERDGRGGEALQTVVSPPSPTPSDTSSLSLYSSDSVTKSFPVDVVVQPNAYLQPSAQGLKRTQQQQQQDDEDERPPSLFCGCINFRAWFGGGSSSKAKENRILGPPNQPIPEPAPQTVQVRRRPSPLNL